MHTGTCMVIRGRRSLLSASAAALLVVALPPSAAAYRQKPPQCRMMATTTPTTSIPPHPARLAAATQLLKEVYGDWDALLPTTPHLFPKPMPASEAGPSMVPYGDDGSGETQRRYLWTDAWGVLGLSTLALREGDENRRARLLQAGTALIEAVHATLGQPRSPNFPMLKAEDAARALGPGAGSWVPVTPHGYVGLRIGKERARRVSDAGMSWDGAYAHYTDKWFFSLLRFSQTCERLGDVAAAEKYLTLAEQLIVAVHPFFMQRDRRGNPVGLYWKLNTDMSPIPGLEQTGPNDDALAWFVVYSLVRHARISKAGGPSPIEREWREMDRVAGEYVKGGIRVSSDPLGYGLLGWKQQWMGTWAEALRARLQILAPMGVLDVETGMMLPFRLYGALLGARLLQGETPPGGRGTDARTLAEHALEAVTELELNDKESPHSTINKSMLAAALDPLAFARWEGDPVLPLPGTGGGQHHE